MWGSTHLPNLFKSCKEDCVNRSKDSKTHLPIKRNKTGVVVSETARGYIHIDSFKRNPKQQPNPFSQFTSKEYQILSLLGPSNMYNCFSSPGITLIPRTLEQRLTSLDIIPNITCFANNKALTRFTWNIERKQPLYIHPFTCLPLTFIINISYFSLVDPSLGRFSFLRCLL